MKKTNDIEQSIRKLRAKTTAALDQRILTDTSQALTQSSKSEPAAKQPGLWIRRTIMKSPWTKFAAAAAVIIVVAIVLVTVLEKSPTPAYALEQTIQANHSVRTIHIKKFTPEVEQPEEFWAEFDESGELYRCRMELPKTADGPKEIVWQDNKVEIWLKGKNIHAIIKDRSVAEQLRKTIEEIDPKLGIKRLEERQANKEVEVKIEEPSEKGQSIRLTVLYLENSQTPGRRLVLQIDPVTKLLTQIEHYDFVRGDYQFKARIEIFDYNQPIDPGMFTLDVPADAMRIDQTTQQIGLAQGDLSDEEIAIRVVREFLEALIAKDYPKASKLYQGIPVPVLEKNLANKNFVRIISIGKPTPSDRNNSLRVSCTYEVEVDGKKSEVQSHPSVRPVFGQPDHWTIDGGI